MADMSTPTEMGQARARAPAPCARARARPAPRAANEKGSREAFLWPTPPFASYPAPTEQTETLPCQLMTGSGADRKYTSARLTFFVPETAVAHLQMPPARTTVRAALRPVHAR